MVLEGKCHKCRGWAAVEGVKMGEVKVRSQGAARSLGFSLTLSDMCRKVKELFWKASAASVFFFPFTDVPGLL